MTTYTTNDFSEIVFGRKSVQVYDETHKISHEEMLTMIQKRPPPLLLLTCSHGVLS